jgi:hypothetical protein
MTEHSQVGRVKDANGSIVTGQYLSAGYTGHGMPRAYGWFVLCT